MTGLFIVQKLYCPNLEEKLPWWERTVDSGLRPTVLGNTAKSCKSAVIYFCIIREAFFSDQHCLTVSLFLFNAYTFIILSEHLIFYCQQRLHWSSFCCCGKFTEWYKNESSMQLQCDGGHYRLKSCFRSEWLKEESCLGYGLTFVDCSRRRSDKT